MIPNLKDHRGHAVIETSLMLLSGHYSWCILVLENLDHVNVFTTEFGNSRHFCAVMRFNQVSEYILAHNATCRRNEDAAIIPGQLLLPKDYLLLWSCIWTRFSLLHYSMVGHQGLKWRQNDCY